MFGKTLLATDTSAASDAVVEYATRLESVGCNQVVLVYALYTKHLVGLDEALKADAAPKLDKQRKVLEAAGFVVDVETPTGVPGQEITRLADERGCKLIVVGSHGHSLVRDMALGGVATDIVHRATVPVLVVRIQIIEEERRQCCRVAVSDLLSHVLYATDFSDNAERAFLFVEELARIGCRRASLIHVQDVTRIRPHLEDRLQEFNEIDRSRLERMASRLRDLGVEDVEVEIPYGVPAKEIVDLVKVSLPSLVVVGTHGRGFVADALAGSVSHNVVRLSQSPVLVVPPVRSL